ncbi:hypothetical protein CRG98_045406 [Punica granatum]|uniref:G-patch domain-containing protein n=1 Tax=Punica granatum TaxID=22663 RepID=A0A2I0HRJ7_PUNGR|nr:hypothetical protein CRG98_045406 [Punica granatum]
MAFAPTVHPINDPLPPPLAPTAVPLPPAAFLSTDSTMHALPSLTVSMHPPIYIVPPPTVPPVTIAQAPVSTADQFPFQTPQPQISSSYPAPPPLNIPPTEPGTVTQAAPLALPTNVPPEAENEQERRIKRMEETIRALQVGNPRFDFSDSDWNLFPGMRLLPKIKIPEFKRYDGTRDPRHHLRHYQSKMLSYWDYEEFVIQTFQDSLMGSALDWFMTLKAGDVPTWTDLSQKFLDQYRFCAETPPTLLDLSMTEMKEGQAFEAYATEWRGRAAKHIPPITEQQQVQLFHFTLRGAPWIHAAGAVPSSLHQKLKFFVEGKLITVNDEEDYAVYKETAVPYISIGEYQNLPFHSFDTISVIRDYGEVGPSRTDRMIGKVLLKNNYVPGTGLGARAQGILRPIEMEEYRNRRGLGFRPSCHEIVQARRGKHLHLLAVHYEKLFRGIPVWTPRS